MTMLFILVSIAYYASQRIVTTCSKLSVVVGSLWWSLQHRVSRWLLSEKH